jgi:hypothetical protein
MPIMLPPMPVDVPAIIRSASHVSAPLATHLSSAQNVRPRPDATMTNPPSIVRAPVQIPFSATTGSGVLQRGLKSTK